METAVVYIRGYDGIMENKMEATTLCWGYILESVPLAFLDIAFVPGLQVYLAWESGIQIHCD